MVKISLKNLLLGVLFIADSPYLTIEQSTLTTLLSGIRTSLATAFAHNRTIFKNNTRTTIIDHAPDRSVTMVRTGDLAKLLSHEFSDMIVNSIELDVITVITKVTNAYGNSYIPSLHLMIVDHGFKTSSDAQALVIGMLRTLQAYFPVLSETENLASFVSIFENAHN